MARGIFKILAEMSFSLQFIHVFFPCFQWCTQNSVKVIPRLCLGLGSEIQEPEWLCSEMGTKLLLRHEPLHQPSNNTLRSNIFFFFGGGEGDGGRAKWLIAIFLSLGPVAF